MLNFITASTSNGIMRRFRELERRVLEMVSNRWPVFQNIELKLCSSIVLITVPS